MATTSLILSRSSSWTTVRIMFPPPGTRDTRYRGKSLCASATLRLSPRVRALPPAQPLSTSVLPARFGRTPVLCLPRLLRGRPGARSRGRRSWGPCSDRLGVTSPQATSPASRSGSRRSPLPSHFTLHLPRLPPLPPGPLRLLVGPAGRLGNGSRHHPAHLLLRHGGEGEQEGKADTRRLRGNSPRRRRPRVASRARRDRHAAGLHPPSPPPPDSTLLPEPRFPPLGGHRLLSPDPREGEGLFKDGTRGPSLLANGP